MAPLFLAGLAALLLGQHRTNYQRIVAHPNPANGYEDYVRASDIVHNDDLSLLLNWTPQQYDQMVQRKKETLAAPDTAPIKPWDDNDERLLAFAKRLHALDYLEVQKMAAHDFGGAIDLVRTGNLKQVWDPRDRLDAESIFPELADFKSVAKLVKADAYARFASGDSNAGTRDLIAGLIFSRRIAGGSLISELVSIACQAILYGSFEERLPQLTEKDAESIVNFADSALAEPPSYLQALRQEATLAINSLDLLFKESGAKDDFEATSDNPIFAYVNKMSPGEKQRANDLLTREIASYYNNLLRDMGSDEANWATVRDDSGMPPAPATITSLQDLADAVINMMTPIHSQATRAVLRARTQLRLLDLHARIIRFRWHNNRLPKDLKEVAPEKLIADPVAKMAFVYELKDDGYRLYSKGLDSTGPIELKYRRPPNLPGQDDGPIPPLTSLFGSP
ncbi:MAG TPA: hypothetical protein VG820_03905 [Fimbriimonadaceae bacterium]|nr:hypothetical protein [Fimbriimonadaceae bacterium]